MITLACLDMAGTTVADGGAVEKSFVEAMVQSGVADGTDQMTEALDFVRASMGQSKITCSDISSAATRRERCGPTTRSKRPTRGPSIDGDVAPMPGAVGRVRRDPRDGDQGVPHDWLRATDT